MEGDKGVHMYNLGVIIMEDEICGVGHLFLQRAMHGAMEVHSFFTFHHIVVGIPLPIHLWILIWYTFFLCFSRLTSSDDLMLGFLKYQFANGIVIGHI